MIKYPARYEKEEKLYYCKFIDFPDASTQGRTLDELKENAIDALSLAISFDLNHNYDLPSPSEVEGGDIIWVEPYPEIRQRMGHRKGCECPVCSSARGERKRKRKIGLFVSPEIFESMREAAREKGVSQNVLWEEAAKKYLDKSASIY